MRTIWEKYSRWIILLLVLIFTNLPYLYAALNASNDYVFGGFLLNPLDGNTYLAKMYQGWRGDGSFTLPYTPDPGSGVFLNVFYLILGHLARVSGSSLVGTFHVARILGSIAALFLLMHFFDRFLSPQAGVLAFALASLGSGLGWMTIPFGGFTSDFWVAEAYPFLSCYANAHFPWGISLILWLLIPRQVNRLRDGILLSVMSLILALVAPFGVAIVIMTWTGVALVMWVDKANPKPQRNPVNFIDLKLAWKSAIWIGVGGIPVLIYDFWVVRTHPVLAEWNAQNITHSPPIWDFVISFSPVILFAVIYLWRFAQKRDNRTLLMVAWAIGAIVLMYIPFGLQRRFIHGLYIPLAGLAAMTIHDWLNRSRRPAPIVIFTLLLLLPTNVVVLFSAKYGVDTHDPKLFLSQGEVQAFAWISDNTEPDALILASPDLGLFIPAQTGRRVIYGHPFESINADRAKFTVSSYYSNLLNEDERISLLTENQVDFVFWGPRERSLGEADPLAGLIEIYDQLGVKLFSWGRE